MEPSNVYKYCPRCGSKFNRVNDDLLKCPNCDLNFYINALPCNSSIVVNQSGEILLGERTMEPYKGFLDTPGGFLSLRESMEACMVREIEEECGIKAKEGELKYFKNYPTRYMYNDMNLHLVLFCYILKVSDNIKIKDTKELIKVKFYNKETIPYEKVGFEVVKRSIRDYLSNQT